MAQSLEYFTRNNSNRVDAMACAYTIGQYTMTEIARYFDVHYSGVSLAVRDHRKMRDCKT